MTSLCCRFCVGERKYSSKLSVLTGKENNSCDSENLQLKFWRNYHQQNTLFSEVFFHFQAKEFFFFQQEIQVGYNEILSQDFCFGNDKTNEH